MIGYLAFGAELTYEMWSSLFEGTAMRIFTLLALLSMAAHVWIGLWSVSTDYIKATGLRFLFQSGSGTGDVYLRRLGHPDSVGYLKDV